MYSNRRRSLLILASLVLASIALAVVVMSLRAATQAVMLDLGTLGGYNSEARAINNGGQVVGWSDTSAGEEHAFVWQNGVMTDLVTLSRAYDINDNGQIVGEGWTISNELHAFIWQHGVITDLGTLGGTESHAYGINNSGQVVGWSKNTMGQERAFLWYRGVMTDLGTLPGGFNSHAYAINDNGQIAGDSDVTVTVNFPPYVVGTIHPFLRQNGMMTDLGSVQSESRPSYAYDVNNYGQVVGWGVNPDYVVLAFIWQNGVKTLLNLDPPALRAYALNTSGQVVGDKGSDSPDLRAFQWDNGTLTTFGTLGGNLSQAFDINDAGQVVGTSQTTFSQTHAFIITTGSPMGAGISGQVTAAIDGAPVAGALVQICRATSCTRVTTDNSGLYKATGLVSGQYTVTVFPPAATALLPNTLGPVTLASGSILAGQQIQLVAIAVFPPGTSISPTHGGGGAGGIPMVYWRDTLLLATQGCVSGTASYEVIQSGNVIRSGVMTEGPAGQYHSSIQPFYPNKGYATVSIVIQCPGNVTQNVTFTIFYFDPSGTVRTVTGAPIIGATMTLFRSDTTSGTFEIVPSGSTLMSPANRANPDLTDADGHFGWDVIAGYYIVRAEKAGCAAPNNLAQPYVESAVLAVPPPVTDLDLRLDCRSFVYLPLVVRQ